MSLARLNKIKYLGIVACFAVAFLGCSSQTSPDQPLQFEPGDVIENPSFVRIVTKPSGWQLGHSASSEQSVGPAGGLVLQDNVTLNFPPGALSSDEAIRIELDASGLLITELGPDDLSFDVPVTLSMDLTGTSAEGQAATVFIVWYNDDEDRWEVCNMLPPEDDNTVRALLEHFSKYGSVGG